MNQCPFCGGSARVVRTHPAPIYTGVCEWCGARGPDRGSITDAIDAWNSRHGAPAIAGPPDATQQPGGPMPADTMTTECWRCRHRRSIPGDSHIACANPDPEMTGDHHGISRGWFLYPINFDPTWKTRLCRNFADDRRTGGGP